MAIEVKDLTKYYGVQHALDGISFSINKGEIVGFLGPNGAGKSTTMKILTGYLAPTSGVAAVEGINVSEDPQRVKHQTGYLPEHNPLYHDMYVHEYLEFAAGICGLASGMARKKAGEMVSLCGLSLEQNKKIGALSKGYRQRVGLAQALIHNPNVLILDEPTSGLDPNQLVEIRRLIKDISREKTVLFSTHILQEVEALCDRVIVINRGVIVADDLLHKLRAGKGGTLLVEFGHPVRPEDLQALPGVERVDTAGGNRFRIYASPGQDIRAELTKFAARENKALLELRQEENSLEAIFSKLTQVSVTESAS